MGCSEVENSAVDFRVSNEALALVSGGLDGLLAARWLAGQGWSIHAVHFETGFVLPEVARRAGLLDPIERVEVVADYLRQVVAGDGPGRGQRCRALLLSAARALADRRGARWIVTGDVLGQDRCAQTRAAFRAADRDAGVEGRVLRPLSSAQLGWPAAAPPLARAPLALHGSSRRGQLALARELGLSGVPATKGGCCRLASARVRRRADDLVAHLDRPATRADVELLPLGRRHRLDARSVLVLARDAAEADEISRLAAGSPRMVPIGGGAPGWLLGDADSEARGLAARLVACAARRGAGSVALELVEGGLRGRLEAVPAAVEELDDTRL